jgi:hypothetical protein
MLDGYAEDGRLANLPRSSPELHVGKPNSAVPMDDPPILRQNILDGLQSSDMLSSRGFIYHWARDKESKREIVMPEEAVEVFCVQDLPMLDFEAGNAGRVVGSPVVLDIFRDIFIGLRDLV